MNSSHFVSDREKPSHHIPVLLNELIDAIVTHRDGIYVDCTFGCGGHTKLLLNRLGQDARVIGIDRDPDVKPHSLDLGAKEPRFTFRSGEFSSLRTHLQKDFGVIDGIYFDLGISTPQIKQATRGFAFDLDGPLDMRMDISKGQPASEWLSDTSLDELTSVLKDYGDVRNARKLATRILSNQPKSTAQLADIVKEESRPGSSIASQLARVFQAIRIHINDELAELDKGIEEAFEALQVGGRLGVITFHSLERRITRRKFAQWTEEAGDKRLPPRELDSPRAKYILRRVKPNSNEISENPAARSALLQVIEKSG